MKRTYLGSAALKCTDRTRCFTDYQVLLVKLEHAQTVWTRPSSQQGEWPGGEATVNLLVQTVNIICGVVTMSNLYIPQ